MRHACRIPSFHTSFNIATVIFAGVLAVTDGSVRSETRSPEQQAKIERLMEQLGNLELGVGATGVVQGTLNNDDNNPDDNET